VLKASLLTFPLIASIFTVSPQYSYAQDMQKFPISLNQEQGTDQEEADDQTTDFVGNSAGFQEVELKKNPISPYKMRIIANTNGDAIKDIGEDEMGN
jgi:hypothetical protein